MAAKFEIIFLYSQLNDSNTESSLEIIKISVPSPISPLSVVSYDNSDSGIGSVSSITESGNNMGSPESVIVTDSEDSVSLLPNLVMGFPETVIGLDESIITAPDIELSVTNDIQKNNSEIPKCPGCYKTFSRIALLKRHLSLIHI